MHIHGDDDQTEHTPEAVVQTEIVRTVETRLGEFETWQGETERRLVAMQSNQEQLLGLMTATQEAVTAMASCTPSQAEQLPAPQPEPPQEPNSSTPPEPKTESPADAVDAAQAPAVAAPAPRVRPRRRFL